MSTSAQRAAQLDLVARLKSAYPELPDAPTPDLLDHERITAYLKPVHDVGGEPDAPDEFLNKQEEAWEEAIYVTCEVLGWRGIWLSEERRRIGNVDVGRAQYLGLPYYGRWALAVARVLVEKHHIGLTELTERMAEVKARYAGGLDGRTPRRSRDSKATAPRSGGTDSTARRWARAIRRCTPGLLLRRSSPSATRCACGSCPCCSTPARPSTRAAPPV